MKSFRVYYGNTGSFIFMDLLAESIADAETLGRNWLIDLMSPKLELGSPDDFEPRTSWRLPLTLCLLKRNSVGIIDEAATRASTIRDKPEIIHIPFKMPNCPHKAGWDWQLKTHVADEAAVQRLHGHPIAAVQVRVCGNTGWEWTAYLTKEAEDGRGAGRSLAAYALAIRSSFAHALSIPTSFHEFRLNE